MPCLEQRPLVIPMLDLKALRTGPEPFRLALKKRNAPTEPIDHILKLDEAWRQVKSSGDKLKNERNKLSMEINAAKKAGQEIAPIIKQTQDIAAKIKVLDEQAAQLEAQMESILLTVPNVPHESVPLGKDESENVEVRKWGAPKLHADDVLPHYDIFPKLLDFERGVKLSGSRFTVLYGEMARLERALSNYMLSVHAMNHYKEAAVPFLVNTKTMTGTGQLPKFAGDLYRAAAGEQAMGAADANSLWLIPTAEVPLTNLHSGEVLEETQLPLRYCALTPCFRSEAGNYQKDIKGLIRQHQFMKVELVKFSLPERSYDELESLTRDAESILQGLGLSYRTRLLCTGDMGFASAKTYDIEVWLPSQDTYREISSCSNCTDFQARRAQIKFRREGKNEFVHTLNGSGLAVGRTLVAILENFQDEAGVAIPKVLQDFMGTERIDF